MSMIWSSAPCLRISNPSSERGLTLRSMPAPSSPGSPSKDRFHFDHLLTPDVADQVYGIADASGLATALDDAHRASDLWALELEGRLERE